MANETPLDAPAARRERRRYEDAAVAQRRQQMRDEVRNARAAGQRWRLVSRWVGLGLFVFGALLLAWVFGQALSGFQQFASSDYLNTKMAALAGKETGVQIQMLVAGFGFELLRVLYLLILGFVASAIASKGISFFSASQSIIDEAVIAEASGSEADAEYSYEHLDEK